MAWSAPYVFGCGDVVGASHWNVTSDDLASLFGDDTAWTTVTSFSSGWTAGTPAPAYIQLHHVVYLRGQMSGGTSSHPAFSLPSGYQPSSVDGWFMTSGGVPVEIDTTGVVTPWATATVHLDGIAFPNI